MIFLVRSLKEIRKYLDKNKKEIEYDGEGRAVIELRVLDDSAFLSPYSTARHNIISEEVSDFIEHSLRGVPHEKAVHFCIHSDVITPEEQREYTKAIHSHYADKYSDSRMEKKHLHRMAAIMTLVAVIALSLIIGFDAKGIRNEVFTEIGDIFAWVFMWEAVDIFFLQCTLLRFKQQRYLRLADSKIEFLPLSKGK
ncbi:MAG: hypothetical protein J6C89_05915 [Clostridia bacterium]|nr:hypothetical protein [Clostridia bacterium]